MNGDKYDLERFIKAQGDEHSGYGSYFSALAEIRSGHKQSHWIWYIFPQPAALGRSGNSKLYGIRDLDEALAYLQHPVLKARLIEISSALLELESNDPYIVMGSGIDALKLKSSMTLFSLTDPDEPVFKAVLDKFYNGIPDKNTLEALGL